MVSVSVLRLDEVQRLVTCQTEFCCNGGLVTGARSCFSSNSRKDWNVALRAISLIVRCSASAMTDNRSATDSGALNAINLFFNIDLVLLILFYDVV